MSTAPTAPTPAAPFKAAERNRLLRINRLLVNVIDPVIARRAAKAGYDSLEHQEGWRLINVANGVSRPFAHFLSEADRHVAEQPDEVRADLKALDLFENTWLPRLPLAVERFVPQSRRAAVLDAVMKNLTQQPEGPAVVASVELLLARVESLATSDEPGLKAAHASLVKKGLTADVLTAIKATLARTTTVPGLPVIANAVPQSELDAAAAAQREAFEALELWYADWAETLRAVMTYHQNLKLGLTEARGGRRPVPSDPDADTDDVDGTDDPIAA